MKFVMKRSMKEKDSYVLAELIGDELIEINGGDDFMKDLGKSLGKICGWIANTLQDHGNMVSESGAQWG
jgi:hypothetical protein